MAGCRAADPDGTMIECPGVEVSSGAATLKIAASRRGEPRARPAVSGDVRPTARECGCTAGIMTMKVGVQGRVIIGPAGGPGTVDVPLRLRVVQRRCQSQDHLVPSFARSR